MRRHLRHLNHPSDLMRHPLQLGCSRSKVEGEGEVVVDLVELVSEVVVDRVVVLLVVLLMRLPCHPSIPRHPLRLPYHTSFSHHFPILSYYPRIPLYPRGFHSTCHSTIITNISDLRCHITIYDITYLIASYL